VSCILSARAFLAPLASPPSCSGLFIPRAVIPAFWQGLYYAVPTSHMLRAVTTSQYFCPGGVPAGCPVIQVPGPDGAPVTVGRYEYAAGFLQTSYQNRWAEIGWAALAVAVMLVIAALAIRFINHQKR